MITKASLSTNLLATGAIPFAAPKSCTSQLLILWPTWQEVVSLRRAYSLKKKTARSSAAFCKRKVKARPATAAFLKDYINTEQHQQKARFVRVPFHPAIDYASWALFEVKVRGLNSRGRCFMVIWRPPLVQLLFAAWSSEVSEGKLESLDIG